MHAKVFIYLSVLACYCTCLNILVVYPHSGKSHFMVFEPLFKALAGKGHQVTVISYFPQKNPLPNYRDVVLEVPSLHVEAISLENVTNSRLKHYLGINMIAEFADTDCSTGLQNKNFQNFLKEDNKFDVLLAEVFNTNCFMGLAKKYEIPFIGLSSCISMPWSPELVGSPYHPAYIPNIFMDYSDKLTFLERLENTIMYLYTKLYFKYRMEVSGNELSKKYLGIDLFENGNIMNNMSLHLTNAHFSLNLPRPLTPSDVEVGGLHVRALQKLPPNIEKWLNESPEGVIYFSLGSLIKGQTFPKDKMNEFLKAFGRLPQRVLWKWGNESMEGKPDNVMIQNWIPQLDVLCHPNVKAFISHGGLLGTIEAVYCGVPIVVMPQFGDQDTNAKALESVGGGVILKLKDATEESVYKSLKTVLSSDFRQSAKELSERFRDRPLPPLETAIYWIEYVAKHKGAPHMKTAAVNMPLYQFYLLDVAAALLFIFSSFIYISIKTLKFVLRKILKTENQKLKKN